MNNVAWSLLTMVVIGTVFAQRSLAQFPTRSRVVCNARAESFGQPLGRDQTMCESNLFTPSTWKGISIDVQRDSVRVTNPNRVVLANYSTQTMPWQQTLNIQVAEAETVQIKLVCALRSVESAQCDFPEEAKRAKSRPRSHHRR